MATPLRKIVLRLSRYTHLSALSRTPALISISTPHRPASTPSLHPQTPHPSQTLFHQIDADGNGQISQAELSSALTRQPHFLQLFDLDPVDVAAAAAQVFTRIDHDRNGCITSDELQAFFEHRPSPSNNRLSLVVGMDAVDRARGPATVTPSPMPPKPPPVETTGSSSPPPPPPTVRQVDALRGEEEPAAPAVPIAAEYPYAPP
mgnify:CR=1 FL=1